MFKQFLVCDYVSGTFSWKWQHRSNKKSKREQAKKAQISMFENAIV